LNPLTDKLADLAAQRAELLSQARAITEKPVLTIDDRKHFEELLALSTEISNYADRLQRRNEKWRRI
jgi:hypothetical protein